ncbi:MAG TPA: hemerythrin domain-containing protein [Candidatus Limnocylindrales bacterium]|jgi:iron-sulfur cluster repair protein YtfE (RIC family)
MVELADVAGAETAFARHEHKELRASLDRMHSAARALVEIPINSSIKRLAPVCAFLTDELMPHVAWEGSVIFPEVEELSATTWPTRLMRFDHIQINRAAIAVERDVERICRMETTSDERRNAYDHLIELEALIRAHLEREEAFLMPILDGRTTSRT